ncbi:MAG: NUDIX domain-containing protein [Chlamydiae bacterium]|nr:NUDIX domain-containing protein [Chlamydiota bacterium]
MANGFIQEESFGVVPLKQEKGEWFVFIILHKQGRHWGFPKGKKDPGEEPKETASRELNEETGMKIVRFLKEIPFVESYQFHREGKRVSKTVHYFPAVVEGEANLQQKEIRAGKWVRLKESLTHLTFREAQVVCEQVMQLLKV